MMTTQTTTPLEQVQRWMLSVITHPNGIVSGIESDEAQQQVPVTAEDIEQIITRSRQCTSLERLQIYGNAYYARLIECLQDEFPALRHALGDETFDAFALAYLQDCPSRSYTLSKLGTDFPHFLRETRPLDIPPESTWPEFLVDLATLERTYSEVFDAPGPERLTLLRSEDLLAIPSERWPDARLIPVECLRLLELRFPVHEYATAARHGEHPTVPAPCPTWLVVSREDFIVRRRPVTRTAFQLLTSLTNGRTIGEAIEDGVESGHAEVDELTSNLRSWFETWAQAGFFRAVEW
jgi:hypothetical protein